MKEIVMTRTALTDTQRLGFEQAAEQPAGRSNRFSYKPHGGTRKRAHDALVYR